MWVIVMRYVINGYEICDICYNQSGVGYEICDYDYEICDISY